MSVDSSAPDVLETVKAYILDEYLPGVGPEELTSSTPLISGGILDSISTIKLVDFLEKTFDIELEAREAVRERLDTLDAIVTLVNLKQEPA